MVGVDYAARSEEIKLSDLQKCDWRMRSVYKLDNSIFGNIVFIIKNPQNWIKYFF